MLTCGFGAFNKDCQTVDVSVKEVATISALNSNVFQSLHTKLLQVFLFLHSIFLSPAPVSVCTVANVVRIAVLIYYPK